MSQPAVAVFDLDGTVTRCDTFLRFLVGCLLRSPGRWWVAPALAWAVAMHFAGRRDNAWLKAFFLARIVGRRPVDPVERWADRHVDRVLESALRPGAVAEIARLRAEGVRLVLASASPDIYVPALARRLGFDDVICTRARRDADGRWTGVLDGGNCMGDEKLLRVAGRLAAIGLAMPAAVAYSDHHADLPLLRAAGRAFAVNPTRTLAAAAAAHGIVVVDWSGAGADRRVATPAPGMPASPGQRR